VYISGFDQSLRSSTILAEYFGADASEKERVSDLDFVYDHSSELSIIEKSMQTGEPVIYHIDDLDLIETDRVYLEKYGGKSVLEIPLKRGGEFNAIIEIWETRHKREFTKNEILLCKTLAQHAAIAIENADLYNQAQKEIKSRMFVEGKLRHETLHDSLTGLANRNLFIDRLEQAIYRFTRNEETRFSVMYLDLDNLKQINDTLGHGEGDIAIIQAARALQKSVRKGDTVSRFGGDEFLILLEGIDNSEINKIIKRINSLLGKINIGEDQSINLSASIGIAVSSTNIKSSDDYIQFADIAMYSAKKKGGNRSEFYNPKK
jgi:diguanylate cyclase (GGDEF)-like protein